MTDPILQPAYRYRARVTHVTDGDTVRLDLDLGCGIWKRGFSTRLYKINARELRGDSRDEGAKDRDHLRWLVVTHALDVDGDDCGLIVETRLDKGDKYGRLLVTLWGKKDGAAINLNEQMLIDGFAVPAPESWG